MEIPTQLLNKWNSLKSRGDLPKIAELAGMSYVAVSNAFKKGRCGEKLFRAISSFYTDKETRMKPYLQGVDMGSAEASAENGVSKES